MGAMRTLPCIALSCLFALLLPPLARAADYEVGPGQAYADPGEVPWEALGPGDRVLIHWRDTPYANKWVVAVAGTADQPIVVRGVPGPGGELPVIDGQNATTREALDFWNDERAVIKVGGSSTPGETPAYVTIENLDIRGAYAAYGFTDDGGNASTYNDNAAAIFVEAGDHITIRHCVLRDSGNGLFVAYQASHVLVDGNFIHGNGNVGSIYEHNSYTEALGITFQYNHYGPLRDGAGGNNLKDRSAGTVVRYNWIEGGNRQLDLVDSDHAEQYDDPSYGQTFVYGNVLVEPDGAGNRQIVHYGGDAMDTTHYRNGTLYFYENTVVSTRSDRTTLLRLSSDGEHADVRNNIVYASAGSGTLSILDETGTVDLAHNWLTEGWVDSFSGMAVTVNDDGSNLTGADPGFVDTTGQDFHLEAGSPCIDAGTALAAAVLPDHPVARQYVEHRAGEPRVDAAPLDLGAFGTCFDCPDAGVGEDDAGTPFVDDAGPPPGDDAGTVFGDDAGTPGGGGNEDGGCGCAVPGGGAPKGSPGALLVLIGLAAVALRRRGP